MGWQLRHHFIESPCTSGAQLRLGRNPKPQSSGVCPENHGSGVGPALAEAMTAVLARRGIEYAPSAGDNSWLWCLGGPDLYRNPPDGDLGATEPDSCIDLQLNVCDLHEAISVGLFPFDLVPESGGSGRHDPRRAEAISIGAPATAADSVLLRLEPWLDDILVLRRD